jgi:hypothetical protein
MTAHIIIQIIILSIEEEFEDIKGVIRICKSKERQYNDQN